LPGENTNVEYYSTSLDVADYIQAGTISKASITGNPKFKDLTVDYTIKFTPSNPLKAPAKIIIEFPFDSVDPSKNFVLDPICRVISGLSENGSPITCVSGGTNQN